MKLLRINDVAERMSVSVSLAYKLVERGELPCIRIGRSIRLTEGMLENWLADRIQESKAG